MKRSKLAKSLLAVVTIVVMAAPGVALAQEFTIDEDNSISKEPAYSPFVDQHYPTRKL